MMEDFVELRQIVKILLKWWWVLVLGTLLGGGSGYGITQGQTKVYESTVTIMVGGFIDASEITRDDIAAREVFAQTYAELARTGTANPREIVALKTSLKKIPAIKEHLSNFKTDALSKTSRELNPLEKLVERVQSAIIDSPPATLIDGGVIRNCFSPELDELRNIAFHGKDWIAKLQKTERERTGIPSLKVSFNNVFGYYIDISNAHKDKVPENYIRKQTLVNSERYITPELKEYEDKILNAEEKIYDLEAELFDELRKFVAAEVVAIQNNARLIALIDCLISSAECAEVYKYSKPVVQDGAQLEIIEGRHPVVEQILPSPQRGRLEYCN